MNNMPILGLNHRILKLVLLALGAMLFSFCKSPSSLEVGAVSSATPEATRIGMDILERGGNAADAAIAIQFALGVTEPAMSGIGGGTQIQIKTLNDPIPFAINGTTLSPLKTPDSWPKDSLRGILRTTIPSTVKVMEYLFEHYGSGSITWEELIDPSIQLAENGFSFGQFRRSVYQKYLQKLENGLPNTMSYLVKPDNTYKNQPMANALKLISKKGANAFYNGEIATTIALDSKKMNGWISQEDLLNFHEPSEIPSEHFTYNGFDIYTQPEPCGGWVIKEILEDLIKRGGCQIQAGDFEMIEAINHGHETRQTKARGRTNDNSGETTHFSVLDKNGMALSVTSSINAYYGSGVANESYGFLYNSYMDDFNFEDPKNIYALGPSKMAYSSMSPTIVMKDGTVVMVIGSPGSGRIISTVAQLIHYYACDQVAPEELINLARVHASNKFIYLEERKVQGTWNSSELDTSWIIRETPTDLMKNDLNPYFGGVHVILKTGNSFLAISDPRRDGKGVVE